MYIPKWSGGLLPVMVKMITAKAPKRQNQLPPDNHGSVGEKKTKVDSPTGWQVDAKAGLHFSLKF